MKVVEDIETTTFFCDACGREIVIGGIELKNNLVEVAEGDTYQFCGWHCIVGYIKKQFGKYLKIRSK